MFTLIIPYHNRKDYLKRTLESVATSRITPAKIILVDNASTDGSADICLKFKETHPLLNILLLTEPRKGAAVARNTGLRAVDTEWVYFFDSDDVFSTDFFETVIHEIHNRDSYDLIACRTMMVFPDGTHKVRAVQYDASPTHQILTGQLSTQSMLMRTSFLRKIGGWNENLTVWDDWELGLRYLLHHPRTIWLQNQAFHKLYQHSESLTGENFASSIEPIKKAISSVHQQIGSDQKMCIALASRCTFLAGHLHKEKAFAEEIEMTTYTKKILGNTMPSLLHLYFKFLHYYVSHAGKGAWKITDTILKLM